MKIRRCAAACHSGNGGKVSILWRRWETESLFSCPQNEHRKKMSHEKFWHPPIFPTLRATPLSMPCVWPYRPMPNWFFSCLSCHARFDGCARDKPEFGRNQQMELFIPERDPRRHLRHRHGQTLNAECVCRCGFAVEEIRAILKVEYDVDLVVMGMQGADYISEKVIGSISTALMREAPCPVLVIDRKVRFTDIKRIVLACDYVKPPRREVFDALKDFAGLFGVALAVCGARNERRQHANALFWNRGHSPIRSFCTMKGTRSIPVRGGRYRDRPSALCGEKQADLMVMVPRKYSFWRGIFYSPLTKRIHGLPCFHSVIDPSTLNRTCHENPYQRFQTNPHDTAAVPSRVPTPEIGVFLRKTFAR